MLSSVFSFPRPAWRLVSLILVLFGGALARGQEAGIAGSMPEDFFPELRPLLESALKQSPEMFQQRYEIEEAQARVYLEGNQRFPSAGGDIRYVSNEEAVSGNESTRSRANGVFYSVSASQALFHWGEIKNRTRAAKLGVLIAEKNFAEAYRTIAVEIRRSYLLLVWQHAILQQARDSLRLLESQLARSRERHHQGKASIGEVLNAELEVEDARLNAERVQMRFDAERRRLGRITGVGELKAEQVPRAIPEPRYLPALANEMVAEFLREGGASSFRVQAADMAVRQADLRYRIASVRLLPKFNTVVGYSRDSYTNATADRLSQTAITRQSFEVRGNWSIFDGFATRGAKALAKAERRQWERRVKAWSDAAMEEAQTLQRSIEIEARAMHVANRRRDGAEAGVRLAEEEFKAGRASELTVDRARNGFYAAEAALAASRAAFLSEWASLVSRVADDPILNQLPSRHASAK